MKPSDPRPPGIYWAPRLDSWGRPRHPHHYPHSSGVILWGVPLVDEGFVITEEAPGVLRQERRYGEEAPTPASERGPGSVAPFDPIPQDVLERMLVLAGVKKGDLIYDLGAGDGRILITAARKYGVRGVGLEIDPGLVKLARENVRSAKLEKLVEIREQDLRSADLSGATVVTLYLSYDGNLAIREQLWRQLRPGARVVSYTFDMGDWPAKIAESYRDSAGNVHSLYLWEVTTASVASRTAAPQQQPQSNRGPLIIDVR